VDPKTKIQIYKSEHIPTLIYGAESCPLTSKYENRIIATEMKFLRTTVGKLEGINGEIIESQKR
jgi:hypothetical protein